MKNYIKYCIFAIIAFFVLLPNKQVKANDTDIFLFSDETKDQYKDQSVICIAKNTTFYEEDEVMYTKVKKITFAEDVETLSTSTFCYFPNVEVIELPENLESTGVALYPRYLEDGEKTPIYILSKLKSLSISTSNPYFTVQDNVLYSKDMTDLIYYPSAKINSVYEMPEFITRIEHSALQNNIYLKTIVIGPRFQDEYYNEFAYASYLPNLKEYRVALDNPYLVSQDGVLFSYDMTELIAYPAGKKIATYTVPATVVTFLDYCFRYATIDELILPSGLDSIETSMELGVSPFDSCHIKSVVIADSNFYATEDGVLYNKDKTKLIYWPSEKVVTNLTFASTLKSLCLTSNIPCISQVTTLTIPRDLQEITCCRDMNSLKTIQVEKGNTKFAVYSGCLYTKSYRQLVMIPPKTTRTSITIPKSFKNYYYNTELNSAPSITTVYVKGTGENFPYELLPNLSFIKLTKGNSDAKVVKNVLYISSMKKLIWYPQCKKDTKFVVPSSVTSMSNNAFSTQNYLQSITLPKNLVENSPECTTWFNNCKKLKEIKVTAGNKDLTAVDGVLFTKDMSTLLCYPAGKTTKNYTVPTQTQTFIIKTGNPYLVTLKLSKSMERIEDNGSGQGEFINFTKLRSITVASGNEKFMSEDGVLYSYNYDKTRDLWVYPMAKTNKTFAIPKDISCVWCEANFESNTYLKTLTSLNPSHRIVGKRVYWVAVNYEELY